MKNTVIRIAVGATLVLALIGGSYVVLRRDIQHAAEQSADKIAERAERATSEGIQNGIEAAGHQAQQWPKETLEEILDTVKAKLPGGTPIDPKNESKPGQADSTAGGFRLPIPKDPFQPQTVVQEAFEIGRQAAQQFDTVLQDVIPLTDNEEMELGRKFQKLLSQQKPAWNSAENLTRVERLAEPLLQQRQRKSISYTFLLINDPSVNAASLPGGVIFLNRGLFDFVQNDVELQFVLGHEIGHVDLKHCVRNFTFAVQTGKLGGKAVEAAVAEMYRLYELSFSENLEFDSDAYAFRRLLTLGHSPEQALLFPRRFLKLAQSRGEKSTPPKPDSVPPAVKQEVLNHFRTHPPNEDRLRRLEGLQISPSTAGKSS